MGLGVALAFCLLVAEHFAEGLCTFARLVVLDMRGVVGEAVVRAVGAREGRGDCHQSSVAVLQGERLREHCTCVSCGKEHTFKLVSTRVHSEVHVQSVWARLSQYLRRVSVSVVFVRLVV